MLTLNGLGHAHRTRDIQAEDYGDVLACHSSVLNLGCCFEQVGDFIGLRDLLILNHDLVLLMAELTRPNLVITLSFYQTELVEDALASDATLGVTRSELSLVLEALEVDLGHVSVKLLPEFSDLLLGLGCTNETLFLTHFFTMIHTVVAKVQFALQVVLIHRVTRIVPLDVLIVGELHVVNRGHHVFRLWLCLSLLAASEREELLEATQYATTVAIGLCLCASAAVRHV